MEAKKKVKTAVYIPKQASQLEQFARISINKGKNKIFKLLKRLKETKQILSERNLFVSLGKLALVVYEKLQA